MAGINGVDYLWYVSADVTGATTPVELECQDGTSLSSNKSVDTREFKNCVKTSISKGYLSATVDIGMEAPLPAGQQIVMNAHDNGAQIYAVLKSPTTGAMEWAGTFKVVATTVLDAPTQGPATQTYEIRQDGSVTRAATA